MSREHGGIQDYLCLVKSLSNSILNPKVSVFLNQLELIDEEICHGQFTFVPQTAFLLIHIIRCFNICQNLIYRESNPILTFQEENLDELPYDFVLHRNHRKEICLELRASLERIYQTIFGKTTICYDMNIVRDDEKNVYRKTKLFKSEFYESLFDFENRFLLRHILKGNQIYKFVCSREQVSANNPSHDDLRKLFDLLKKEDEEFPETLQIHIK